MDKTHPQRKNVVARFSPTMALIALAVGTASLLMVLNSTREATNWYALAMGLGMLMQTPQVLLSSSLKGWLVSRSTSSPRWTDLLSSAGLVLLVGAVLHFILA